MSCFVFNWSVNRFWGSFNFIAGVQQDLPPWTHVLGGWRYQMYRVCVVDDGCKPSLNGLQRIETRSTGDLATHLRLHVLQHFLPIFLFVSIPHLMMVINDADGLALLLQLLPRPFLCFVRFLVEPKEFLFLVTSETFHHSMDRFQGKSAGNHCFYHGFYHWIWGLPVNFPLNQSIDPAKFCAFVTPAPGMLAINSSALSCQLHPLETDGRWPWRSWYVYV